ncbi:XRE family transcriptional regulator [Pseudonocardia sp. WMMC193]|uniref:XRE family transcriptional regulator n=1 Tax=Pseudonocardia sp. WMMC193 TaxID=2911965 RepID=UPI001F383144|nr:XRE family transcriptional regulator [Pseudonocardia sp. WMMC193]MCF7550913.1 XRE family transcriptional regulator [Pseudonocardia sp. WMMC193]
MEANEQLSALILEAGFVNPDGTVARKKFGRAVTTVANSRGVEQTYSHVHVGRWLNGSSPRDKVVRESILRVLGTHVGRTVHPDEVGFGTAGLSPDVGLRYSSDPDESATTLATLLQADIDQVAAVVGSQVAPAAWSEASLAWVARPQDREAIAPTRVGAGDVVRVRQTRASFALLDNQFGGGHTRRSLVTYLRDDLPPVLRASSTSDTRAELLSAAAEITQLAAWASYDDGHHGLAQRYFVQALGLAGAADDTSVAAGVLDAMSHQATFLGRFNEAATLARAALVGSASLDIPILNAHFHLMEARALARTGDAVACDRALSRAVTEYERHSPGDGPEWVQYVDDAEVAAEFAHCQRDLDRSDQAIHWAQKALLDASGSYARSDFFATMVLAQAQFDAGLPEEGALTALTALTQGETLRSSRSVSYVVELRQRLKRYRGSRVLADFTEQARERRLWQATISRQTSRGGSRRSESPRSA